MDINYNSQLTKENKLADYRSPEFFAILANINKTLTNFHVATIADTNGKFSQSKYNKGKYGNVQMWRVTNENCPQLLNSYLMNTIKKNILAEFPQYVQDKVITFGNPSYTTNYKGEPMASIVIMVTELEDNVITKADLEAFIKGDTNATRKCLEIESRMYRRAGDIRDPMTRLEDFSFSLIYEPKLVQAKLLNIDSLNLKHQTEAVILETDYDTDFEGCINGAKYNIEGKSTRVNLTYDETNPIEFGKYFTERYEQHKFGSIHKADYILFVLKQTGQVIGINANNFNENWLAGRINL